MSQFAEDVKRSVTQFVASCGRDYEFPAGGKIELLTRSEEELHASLQCKSVSDAEKVKAMSGGLNWSQCFKIVIFGVRLAVLAVRRSDSAIYKDGVIALAAGSPKIDWRATLAAFAIFENCGKRLSISFRDELESVVKFTDQAELRPTIDGYFRRTDDMRAVDVLGYVESGTGNQFTFRSKS
jgi:hypothetical protein